MSRPLHAIVALLLTLLCGGLVAAPGALTAAAAAPSASPTLPVGDPAYDDLDRLDALGLLPGSILGHRPISQNELLRLLDMADSLDAPGLTPAVAGEIRLRLRRRFAVGEPRWRVRDATLSGGASAANRPGQAIPSDGLGAVDAEARPLHGYRQGEPFATDGVTSWLEARAAASLLPWLAVAAGGELRELSGGGPDADGGADFRLRAAQVRVQHANLVLEAGREAAAWGPLTRGGMLLSTNVRPMDMVMLTCDRPYRFPGFLRHVGPVRQTLFVAGLGHDRIFADARLLAVRQTFRVTRHLELGFIETLIFDGEDAPRYTLGDLFYEVIPFRGRNGRPDLSDHRYGMDGRLQLWPRRLLLYGEVFIDDSRAPLYDYFKTLLAKRVGLYAPAFGPGGRLEARVEYADLPAISYRHGRWLTGYALGRRLIGDELGPDARGAHLELTATLPAGHRLSATFDHEGRDHDIWGQTPGPTPDHFTTIFRLEDFPTEWRSRVMLNARWRASSTLDLLPRAGLERSNQPLDDAGHRAGAIVELGFEYRPRLPEQPPR